MVPHTRRPAVKFVADYKKAVVELYGIDPKNNSDYSRIIIPCRSK
jgi:hypothetical protein